MIIIANDKEHLRRVAERNRFLYSGENFKKAMKALGYGNGDIAYMVGFLNRTDGLSQEEREARVRGK